MTASAQAPAFTETPRVSNKHFNDRDQRLRRRHSMTRHRQGSYERNKKDHVIIEEEEEEEEEGHNFIKKVWFLSRSYIFNEEKRAVTMDI